MDVNIHDKRGQDAIAAVLGVLAAIIGGIVLFGLIPGVMITSILNYFISFSMEQLWGLSILFSTIVLIALKKKYKDWTLTFKRYAIFAAITGCLLGLSTLFFKYNFPVRTVMRMFDSNGDIPFKYLTAPSEINKQLTGTYAGESHNKTYNSKGEVKLRIFRVNTETDSVDANIEWSKGLSGFNRLRGTLKNGQLKLFTISSDRNEPFTTEIIGELKDGKTKCSYTIKYDDKDEVQEGVFTARNIKAVED
jgi:hypothetical protein